MYSIEELHNILIQRMENEFNDYMKKITYSESMDVLRHAYDYSIKQDIIFALRTLRDEVDIQSEAFAEMIKGLYKLEHPLQAIYEHYYKHEHNRMDDIRWSAYCVSTEKAVQ